MSTLRTDYKDDVFTGSRKYRMIDNGDGTVSFEDVTTYTQTGDTYGAAEINEVNTRLNGLDGSVYKAEDGAETAIADNDYFPFFDTSASASKKSLWSNIVDKLKAVLAIKEHSSNSAGTYGAGTGSSYGHVKLSDNYSSGTSQATSSVGASEYAVTTAYKTITGRLNSANTSGGYAPTGMKTFTFDYKNGKYGWNESTDRTGTFHPFKEGVDSVSVEDYVIRVTGNGSVSYSISVEDYIVPYTGKVYAMGASGGCNTAAQYGYDEGSCWIQIQGFTQGATYQEGTHLSITAGYSINNGSWEAYGWACTVVTCVHET